MANFSIGEKIINQICLRAERSEPLQSTRTPGTRLSLLQVLAAATLLAAAEGCASQSSLPGEGPDKIPGVSSKADMAAIISDAVALTISEPVLKISPPPPELRPPPIEPRELPIGDYYAEKKLDASLTPERYYKKLVETLTTPELLKEFFQQYWHYNTDEAPGINHPDPSYGVHSINGDRWQTPLQTITRGLIGDCDDQAFLAAAILQDQGKIAFPIKYATHAFALWAEYNGMEWIMRSQCTRGQYNGLGKTLPEAYKTWWNEYRKSSNTPNDPAPSSLELMRIEENKGISSLHPLQILQQKNLADQIDQARKLLEQSKAKECLDILYRLPLDVQKHPLLRELEETAKDVYWTQETHSRLMNTTQKLPR